MHSDLARVVITERALKQRVAEMAADIVDAYAGQDGGITIVSILAGSIIFLGDLIRQLPMRMRIGLVWVSSYPGKATGARGSVIGEANLPDLQGRDVLILDDILDTGHTLRLVQDRLHGAGARTVKTAVLLRKPAKAPPDVPVEFVGFDVDDEFVVGYGLDYDGLYRNLPFIAVLHPRLYESGCPT